MTTVAHVPHQVTLTITFRDMRWVGVIASTTRMPEVIEDKDTIVATLRAMADNLEGRPVPVRKPFIGDASGPGMMPGYGDKS